MGGEQRRPSAGTVRVHEVQLAHILEYLNALPSLDEDGAILLGEADALSVLTARWREEPEDVDLEAVTAETDRLHRRVFNPDGYRDRRSRPVRYCPVDGDGSWPPPSAA